MSFLPLRALGKTPLQVTNLCLGCAPLGNMPETFTYEVAEQQALDTLHAAFQSPVNFLDTAYSYGDGESERRIGQVLKELGGIPPGFVVATKADRHLQTGDFSGDQIQRSVERSLRLLGLERLQVVYLHDPEHTTFESCMKPGGPVPVLHRLKDEGIIGHVGMAGGPVDLMARFVETGQFEALITHNRYTLLNRSADSLIEQAAAMGIAVLNAAPYGSGVLAKGPEAYPRYAYQEMPPKMLERVRRLDAVCREFGVPLAAAALQFSLRDPRITSTIVGFSRPERLQQTITLANTHIPNEIWAQLDAVGFDTVDPEADRWK